MLSMLGVGALVASAGMARAGDEGHAPKPEARQRLLPRMLAEPRPAYCFVENPTAEEMVNISGRFGARPVAEFMGQGAMNGLQPRFFNVGGSNGAWDPQQSDGLGAASQARPETLTYSFPNDGVTWQVGGSATNNLNATMTTRFGATDLDEGRELIRQGLAQWRRWTGLNYSEIADDNTLLTNNTARSLLRGDIRIGCLPQGTGGVLAYNYYPNSGGDMTINSDYFVGNSSLGGSSNTYRYLRNVISHEHGHGLGFIHPTPCNNTKVMEPFINTNFDGLQIDDIRGGQRNYGDRFAGNISAATAKDFGDLTSPIVTSVIAKNLSTNGSAGANSTNADWFKFTLSSTQDITLIATPIGGSYPNAQQTSDCNPSLTSTPAAPTITPGQAGNLTLELRDSSGVTIFQIASSGAAGVAEVINAAGLPAGTYTVRVIDIGPNDAANQYIQLYDLTIRVGASKAPPVALAGINKRVAADTNCFFYGNINSYTTDSDPTGSTNSITAYAWDFDGDGVTDSSIAQPNIVPKKYPSNGVYTVTLRITDENARTATDQITVTVFGATTVIDSVSPASASAGVTDLPITINGKNFKGVTSLSQIVFTGGITLGGAPVVNPNGTQITGVTMSIAAGATPGDRDLTITNSDGLGATGSKTAAFTVGSSTGACCAVDGGCTITSMAACVSNGGTYLGNGIACTPGACPNLTGACCASDGQCSVVPATECSAGYQGNGSICSPNPCPQPTGACCNAGGECTISSNANCADDYQGDGTVCGPNPCDQPTGACCTGIACATSTQDACAGPSQRWAGAGSVCNVPDNNITPCCKADFNQSSQVSIDDLFLYMNAWFSSSPTADISDNGAGTPTIDDLFLYINAYFVGC